MATTFEEIRSYVRVILGDDDSQNYVYTDEALNQHIRLQVYALQNSGVQEDGSSESFTQTLLGVTIAELAYRVSKGVISGTPDFFQYRTPVMSATRSGSARQLIDHCEQMIGDLQGGFLALKEDNEIFALLSCVERWERDYRDGIAAIDEIV